MYKYVNADEYIFIIISNTYVCVLAYVYVYICV